MPARLVTNAAVTDRVVDWQAGLPSVVSLGDKVSYDPSARSRAEVNFNVLPFRGSSAAWLAIDFTIYSGLGPFAPDPPAVHIEFTSGGRD